MKAFLAPGTSVGHLDAEVASGLVIASADLALVLDEAGAIRDIGFGSDDLAAELRNGHGWVGKPWIETVTSESRVKVAAMLGPAAGQQGPRWRHVNHLMPEGASLPILCTVAPLGAAGRRVVFGRDLRPLSQLQQRLVEVQQTMERDYSRLRQAETRYRLLFQMSVDPLVVLDSDTLRVLEANPAAQRLFAHGRRLAGRPLPEMFGTDDRAPLQALLATLRTAGRADDLRAQLADGGPEVLVSASTFRQEGSLLLLVRLEVSAADAEPGAAPEARTRVLKVIEGVPDAFIVTDQEARILMANAAFMDMAQLTADEQARGMPLDRWLGRDGVEFEVLLATLRNRGAVRLYTSTLRGALGALTEVEISAVAVLHGGEPSFGFLMRDTGSRVRPAARAGRNTTRSVEQLTELIGQVPLKELVREATDAIERLAIEAALELTGDNRASAAELLGLSRQSLYVKLRRYGLGDLGVDDPAEG